MQKIQTGTGCVARRDVHVVESWLDFQFMPKEVDNYRTEMLTVDVDGLAKIVLKEKQTEDDQTAAFSECDWILLDIIWIAACPKWDNFVYALYAL